jgi:hypothetical protein
MKQKLNEVALKVYGHRFSTLMNWKDGKERQKVVRDIVEGRTPSSGIKEVLQKRIPAETFKHVIVFVLRIAEQYKLCFYHVFDSHRYHQHLLKLKRPDFKMIT